MEKTTDAQEAVSPTGGTGNVCMGEKVSCSACCGLFNLRLHDAEREAWVQTNTDTFLATDISRAENIVAYRRDREAETLPLRVRDDIYVCPFVGFVAAPEGSPSARRTGCLLHPQGSPHPQIGQWEHPQNFSFYGEGICLAYDCLAKDRGAHGAGFLRWANNKGPADSKVTQVTNSFAYGRLASDHTLHRSLSHIDHAGKNLAAFFDLLAQLYADFGVVTTSFEDIERAVPETMEELCRFLAKRIDAATAEKIAAELLCAWSPP